MMKIHSIIHIPRRPTPTARPGPGLALAGLSCTCLEMGAKGPSLGALHRAAKWQPWTIKPDTRAT